MWRKQATGVGQTMDFGVHIGPPGCLTTRENIMAVASDAKASGYALIGVADPNAKSKAEGQRRMFTGSTDDMLQDAAAFAAVGVKHLIVYVQEPTIEATLDVQQRFAEDVVRKTS